MERNTAPERTRGGRQVHAPHLNSAVQADRIGASLSARIMRGSAPLRELVMNAQNTDVHQHGDLAAAIAHKLNCLGSAVLAAKV
jgi:hypothetical protein